MKWTDFLKKSIDVAPSPIFFQFVVDCVFEVLMKNHYQLDVQQKEQFDVSLTYEEENALRYTAGYVVKAVLKKLKRSTNPMKKELCRYAMELNTNDGSEQESEDWTALVDRGGLTHVGDMTYGVFHSMELEVKLFFGRQPYQIDNVKEKLMKKIIQNEDVLFFGLSYQQNGKKRKAKLFWNSLSNIILQYVVTPVLQVGLKNTSKHRRSRHKSLKESGNSYFHQHSTMSSFIHFFSTFCYNCYCKISDCQSIQYNQPHTGNSLF